MFDPGLILFYVGTFLTLFLGMFYFITFFNNRGRVRDPKIKRFPKVSIIVPAHNEAATIGRTIESLLALNYPDNKVEIIVVDDGSADATYAISKSFGGRVKAITKPNGGKGSAINRGLEEVEGELVGVMDADSFVTPKALRNMIGYFRDPEIMAVTPTLKVHNPTGFWHQIQYIEYLFSVFFRKVCSFIESVYVTPGPFSIYRKEFFDKHGGFDEDNVTEDLEIALRIQANGYGIENSLNAEVFTVAPNTFRELLHQRVRWYSGVLTNLWSYRRMISPQFGNLGIFVLPVALFSVFLVLAYLVYYGTIFAKAVIAGAHQIYLTDFDVASAVGNYASGYSIWHLISPISVLIILALIFMLATFLLVKIYSRDKTRTGFSLIMYMLTYGPIFSIFWFTTLAYKALQLRVRW